MSYPKNPMPTKEKINKPLIIVSLKETINENENQVLTLNPIQRSPVPTKEKNETLIIISLKIQVKTRHFETHTFEMLKIVQRTDAYKRK